MDTILANFENSSDYIYLRTYLVDGKPAEYSVYDYEKKEYEMVTDLDKYFSEFKPLSKQGSIIVFDSIGGDNNE